MNIAFKSVAKKFATIDARLDEHKKDLTKYKLESLSQRLDYSLIAFGIFISVVIALLGFQSKIIFDGKDNIIGILSRTVEYQKIKSSNVIEENKQLKSRLNHIEDVVSGITASIKEEPKTKNESNTPTKPKKNNPALTTGSTNKRPKISAKDIYKEAFGNQ